MITSSTLLQLNKPAADRQGCHQLRSMQQLQHVHRKQNVQPSPRLLCAVAARQQAVHVEWQQSPQPPADRWQTPVAIITAAALLVAAAWPRPPTRTQLSRAMQNILPEDPGGQQPTQAAEVVTQPHSSGHLVGSLTTQQQHLESSAVGNAAGTSQAASTVQGSGSMQEERPEGTPSGAAQGAPDIDSLDEQQWARLQGLGRIIIVARRRPTLTPGIEKEQGYFKQLLDRCRGGVMGPQPTGLLLAWRSCVLLVLEGGNNQLMVALRHLLNSPAEQHSLMDARVISFVLDAQSRMFNHWSCAEVRMRDMGVPTVLEQAQWASGVRDVELFVRAAGTQLSGITQAAARQMLRDPMLFFGDKLPAPKAVLSLATNELGPTLQGFLDAYDIDYKQYCELKQQLAELHEAGAAAGDPSMYSQHPHWRLLHGLYGQVWELEAQQLTHSDQEAEEPVTSSPLAHLYPKKRAVVQQ